MKANGYYQAVKRLVTAAKNIDGPMCNGMPVTNNKSFPTPMNEKKYRHLLESIRDNAQKSLDWLDGGKQGLWD